MNNLSDDYVTIAVLGKPRGNRGEITSSLLTSKPERFQGLQKVYLDLPGTFSNQPFDVEEIWEHDGVVILKFRGVDSISDAEKLRNAEVRVPRTERVRLEPGEFFHSDLIGCELRDHTSGRLLGKVTDVEEYGGPTLLQIDGGRMLVPFVKAICVDIRPEQGFIGANLPDGLEDLSKA